MENDILTQYNYYNQFNHPDNYRDNKQTKRF